MHEIQTSAELLALLELPLIDGHAFQGLDLRPYEKQLMGKSIAHCLFLGCRMSKELMYQLQFEQGNQIFPELNMPFQMFRGSLYDHQSIYKNYDRDDPKSYFYTPDHVIYSHYVNSGKQFATDIRVTLAQRLHDHAMTDAMEEFIAEYAPKKRVAIMGGHQLSRTDADYLKVVQIAKALAEKGYLMLSGGGPGAMEATHLGAWMAHRKEEELQAAMTILSQAPTYAHEGWLSSAFEVIERFPNQHQVESLGIPTWAYGHEPPTPFASKIAKYFANSVREEGLLAIAHGGVIFTPGSAGTLQEIFQDACQNHYESYGKASPMIFLNKPFWEEQIPVYPLLKKLKDTHRYRHLNLSIVETPKEVLMQLISD